MRRDVLVSLCKNRNLPTGGSKTELTKRILDSYEWSELLSLLLTVDRMEWWQLLFLRPMLTSVTTRKGILDHKIVLDVFKEIRRTFRSDHEYFLDRKMKFLIRSGLVIRSRKGRDFLYSINEPFLSRIQTVLTNLTVEDVLKRYHKSEDYESFLKHLRPGARAQNSPIELEAEPPQFSDPNAQLTRIVAFSDYRVQDINLLIEFLRSLNPTPDLILYSGDDVDRFGSYSVESLRRLLALATSRPGSIQRMGGPGVYGFSLQGTLKDSKSVILILAQKLSHHARVREVLTPALTVPKEQSDGKLLSKCLRTGLLEAGISAEKVILWGSVGYLGFLVDSDEFNGSINVFASGNQDGKSSCIVDSEWLTFASGHLGGVDLSDLRAVAEALESNFQVLVERDGRGNTKGLIYASATQRNLLEEIASCSHYGICAVIGNDDHWSIRELITGNKVYNVHKASVILGQYAVIGQEGAPIRPGELSPGIVMYTEDEIKQHLDSFEKFVKGRRLIVVSHPPPYEMLDHALRFGDRNIGSEALRDFITKHSIDTQLVVCGHVHHNGGMTARTANSTLVVNAASHDNFGEPGKIAIIDIDEVTATEGGEMHVQWHIIHELAGLFGVGPRVAEKLREAGIRRVEDLLKPELSFMVDGLSPSFMKTLAVRARAIVDGRPYVLSSTFEVPDGPAMYLDIETDVMQSVVWLVGVYSDRTRQFKSFFANDPKNEERKILEQLSEFGREQENERDPIYYYSGSNFDKRVLEARFRKYGIEQNLTYRMVDLCLKVRNAVAIPLKSYGLKDLARYFGYQYKHQNLDGWAVATMYFNEYLKNKNLEMVTVFTEYNQDDVLFLPQLIHKVKDLVSSHPNQR